MGYGYTAYITQTLILCITRRYIDGVADRSRRKGIPDFTVGDAYVDKSTLIKAVGQYVLVRRNQECNN
jgi:hypothetical protein